jgi:hypothetical protein
MSAGTSTQWCTSPDGSSLAGLVVTLRNGAPADAAALPNYITGGGSFGVPPGITRTVAYVYLPTGTEIETAVATGASVTEGFKTGTDQGRVTINWGTDLAPGEEATLTIRVRTPQTASLEALTTPIVNTLETSGLASSCEIA